MFIPGQPDPKPDSNWYSATYIRITPEYFDAIGAELQTGRFFSDGDDHIGRKVAIVNQVFADRYFHGKAIGQHFGVERELESQFEIVGIVENTKHNDPNVPRLPCTICLSRRRRRSLSRKTRFSSRWNIRGPGW